MGVGITTGIRCGIGAGPVQGDPFAAFRDALSGQLFPITQAQLNQVFDSIGVARKTASHSYGLQDASGNPVATIGTNLTVTGTLDYQQNAAGYTRKALVWTETAAERAVLAAGVAPNLLTTSGLFMSVANLTTAGGAGRGAMGLVGASGVQLRVGTNAMVNFCVGTTVTGAATTNQFRPYALRYNRTAGNTHSINNVEKLAGTYNATPVDGEKGIGNTGNPAPGAYLAFWIFSGANAEWTDAEIKAFWQRCGWAIPW